QRPVLRASELQRQLPLRQGAEGEVPLADHAGGRVPSEQVGLVRYAWECMAMVCRCLPGGLEPGEPGRLLCQRRLRLPGGGPQRGLAVVPDPQHRRPTCPSSRPVGGQASRSERPLSRSARAVPRNVRRSITQTPPQRRKTGTTNGRPAVKTCPITPSLE